MLQDNEEEQVLQDDSIKIIWKGKRIDAIVNNSEIIQTFFKVGDGETSLAAVKLIVLSTTKETIQDLQDRKKRHDEAIKNYNRALLTRPKHEIISAGYARKLEVLSEFSNHQHARELLIKVRDDPAIKQIMKVREWRIGSLIELHPHRDSTLLGYNQNKGMIIALRLRTDALDGFRTYSSIIKVMLHELAHMIFSGHDSNFHALDRELNQDYSRFIGKSLNGNKHNFSSGDEGIVPIAPQKLGGKLIDLQGKPMREVLATAAVLRLTKEEQEMDDACGLR